jgi:flagellar basal-body rod modification protein FlgD
MQTGSTSNNLLNTSLTGQNNGAVATQASTAPNRDMFTKLLVAQIQNQDPLAPQDPTTYVNQLSQLSQTEALQNMSQSSSANASLLQSLQTLAMGGQVGAQVTVATSKIQLDQDKVSGAVQLDGISQGTNLVLTGPDGQQHTIALGAGSGTQSFTIDPAALGLPAGSYTIQAKPSDGSSPQVEIAARLNSVRVTSAGVVLQVAGVGQVDPSAITGFNGKSDGV